MDVNIPGIDVETGIKNSGSLEFLMEILGDVYHLMDEKVDLVESYLAQGNIKDYTVMVHSLKTTCRMIGAVDLGEDFFTLEKLGKEENIPQINAHTPDVLKAFMALKPYLKPYAEQSTDSSDDFLIG